MVRTRDPPIACSLSLLNGIYHIPEFITQKNLKGKGFRHRFLQFLLDIEHSSSNAPSSATLNTYSDAGGVLRRLPQSSKQTKLLLTPILTAYMLCLYLQKVGSIVVHKVWRISTFFSGNKMPKYFR